MRFPIRPGKVTCAGLVGILMVLPSSIWKKPGETDQRDVKAQGRVVVRVAHMDESARPRVKFRKVPR